MEQVVLHADGIDPRAACQLVFDLHIIGTSLMVEGTRPDVTVRVVDDELVVLDSFSKADFVTEGVAKISYLTGDTAINQKYITINFPE